MNLRTIILTFLCTILVVSKDNSEGIFKRDANEGSILPAEFISELFRFGSVALSQIKSMNVDSIQKAVNVLKTFPNELQKNENFDEIGDLFESIGKVLKEADGIGNIAEWKQKEDFIKDIRNMAANGIDFTAVDELRNAMKSWSHENEKLTDDSSKLNNHVALGALISLQGYTETIINALNRLPSIISNLKFEIIETATGALQSILKASEEIEKFSDDVAKLQKVSQVKYDLKNFSSFSEVAEKLNPIISYLTIIRTVVNSRSTKNRHLKYTHGFLDGVFDILRTRKDLENPWIQNVVNEVDFSKLLGKLEEFGELAAKTEKSMKFLDEQTDLQSVDKLLSLANGVLEVSSKSEDGEKSISNILECVSIIPDSISDATLVELENKAFQIDDLLRQIKMFLEKLIRFSEESNAVKMFEETLIIVKKANDLSTVVDVVKQYNMNPNLKNLLDFIEKCSLIIQEFFSPINKSKKLKNQVKEVENKLKYLDSYHEMLRKYSMFFRCLQDIDELDSSSKTFSLINYVRKLEPNDLGFIDDGMKVVKNMTVVSKNLEDLEKFLDRMKNYKSVETDALKIFENASMHSKVIGSATRGVSIMKNVLDEPKLELNVSVILEQLNTVYPPLSKEDVDNLNGIISLRSELPVMYKSLEEFQDNIQEQNSSKLFDHFGIFREAEKVIGIQGNVTNMIRSVEKLAEKLNDVNGSLELFTLKDHLEKVENVGVYFSEFSEDFQDSQDTLAALDLFFANYFKVISETTTNKSEVGFLNASTAPTTFSTTKKSLYLEGYIGWSLFVLVVLLSVGALSYASYVFMCKKESAKRTKKKKKEDTED